GAFARQSEDDMPWEGDLFGLGRTFPHKLTGGKEAIGPDYYEALIKTPYGNEVELAFASSALIDEKLGQGEGTDILAISLSANDECGHTFGPYSREVLDMTVATDRQLASFLRSLNPSTTTVVLTADHGASPMPEYM